MSLRPPPTSTSFPFRRRHFHNTTRHAMLYNNLYGLTKHVLTSLLHLAGYDWPGSSPLRHSPDTTSPMYPDRPIRPLPKRRLRARLSPEQAESIVFPPAPPSSGPLFSFPYSQIESRSGGTIRVGQHRGDSDHHRCHCGANHSEVESDEEEDERVAGLSSSPTYGYERRAAGKAVGGAVPPYPKAGSASSADGYESFENTNNKKKRKIPNNMGSTGSSHASLAAEIANMGISRSEMLNDYGEGPGYGSPGSTPQNHSSGTGIAGAGRGRFGRTTPNRSERRVLSTSNNLANAKANGKRELSRQGPVTGTSTVMGTVTTIPTYHHTFTDAVPGPSDQGGIISAAIANAQATPAPSGNENISLLHQEASKAPTPKSQFTFTCGSDSANKMVWPGQQQNHPYPSPPGSYPPSTPASMAPQPPVRTRPPVRPDAPMVSTQATQTSPSINGPGQSGAVKGQPPMKPAQQPAQQQPQQAQQQQQQPQPSSQQGQQQHAPPPRKPRRNAAKMYAYAARKRRLAQEYQNFHNPPVLGDMWICEFCEYEDIFGVPPVALIRQYEIKDRKERKRLAEKRRLLEKARMKGRKGKKASKKAQQNANNQQNNQNAQSNRYDQRLDDQQLDGQDEEYYDDSYDDAPHGTDKPCHHHVCNHAPHPPHPPNPKVGGDPHGGGKAVSTGA